MDELEYETARVVAARLGYRGVTDAARDELLKKATREDRAKAAERLRGGE